MSGQDSSADLSPEERELISLQTDMLRDARGAAASGAHLNELLTPILLEQAGYSATRAERDVYNPEYVKARDATSEIRQQLIDKGKRFGVDLLGDKSAYSQFGKEDRDQIDSMREKLDRLRSQRDSLERYTTRKGDITGIEALPDTEAETLRKENETLLLQRQNSALRGELPVNPALLSSLDQQEEDLKASLLENLGTGYETSSPGIEALAKFGEKKQAVLEAARRDDISGAGSQANELGAFIQGVRGQHQSETQSIVNGRFGEATALAGISQAYSGPLSFLQQDRMAGGGLNGGQQAGLAGIGYGAQTGNPYVAGAGALAYLFYS